MSQSYTSDCYAGGHVAQTDLQNIENNFAAVKSNFSGASAPSNPIAGMPWFDSSTGILKWRNTANNAFNSLLDVNSGYALKVGRTISAGTGLSGGGTLTTDLTISHAPHSGDVTGTTALSIGDNVVKGDNLNQNAVTFLSHGETLVTNALGWFDKLSCSFTVPSGKGNLRLFARLYNTGDCYGACRLKVGAKTSTGSGSVHLSTSTSFYDCGAVSLSTFTAGEKTFITIQGYRNAVAGTAIADRISVCWGSST